MKHMKIYIVTCLLLTMIFLPCLIRAGDLTVDGNFKVTTNLVVQGATALGGNVGMGANSAILDGASVESIHPQWRYLADENGTVVVQWNRYIPNAPYLGQDDKVYIPWRQFQLWDSGGRSWNLSVDWDQRGLYDFTSVGSIDWENRLLIGFGGGWGVVDWGYQNLNDIDGMPALNWNARQLQNMYGDIVADWSNADGMRIEGNLTVTASLTIGGNTVLTNAPTLQQVTDAGAATTKSIEIGGFTMTNGDISVFTGDDIYFFSYYAAIEGYGSYLSLSPSKLLMNADFSDIFISAEYGKVSIAAGGSPGQYGTADAELILYTNRFDMGNVPIVNAHFDRLHTFETWGSSPPSNAVLNVAEMDVRYINKAGGRIAGNITVEGELTVTQAVVVARIKDLEGRERIVLAEGEGALKNMADKITVDFQNCALLDAEGALAADWTMRQLQDWRGWPSVDWSYRELYDVNNNLAASWDARELNDKTGAQAVEWGEGERWLRGKWKIEPQGDIPMY